MLAGPMRLALLPLDVLSSRVTMMILLLQSSLLYSNRVIAVLVCPYAHDFIHRQHEYLPVANMPLYMPLFNRFDSLRGLVVFFPAADAARVREMHGQPPLQA
jgi:hypothetical protein